MTLTRSKVKVTGLRNFRKLAKLWMLAAVTISALAGLSGCRFRALAYTTLDKL